MSAPILFHRFYKILPKLFVCHACSGSFHMETYSTFSRNLLQIWHGGNHSIIHHDTRQFCVHQLLKKLRVHHTFTQPKSLVPLTWISFSLLQKRHFFTSSVHRFRRDRTMLNTCTSTPPLWDTPFKLPEPELDWAFLLDRNNTELIARNILNRKGIGDIHKVISLSEKLCTENDEAEKDKLRQELLMEALDIPNMSHPSTIVGDESMAREVEIFGTRKNLDFKPRTFNEIAEKGLRMMRFENLAFSSGPKTYYFEDRLARLEQALVAFTVDSLLKKGFEIVSVPDLLYDGVIEGCGFKTKSERSQVYKLYPQCLNGACLAGTAEMSLAGYFMNEVIPYEQLPKRVMAVSRCYRAEAKDNAVDKGLYRVHHFTKVEMFGLTACEDGTESETLLQEMLSIEKELFSSLGLHFRILDMPTQELGAPAHKKYDIESWMYGRNMWGEISSCSNCTDYQSRRLNIKYMSPSGDLKHAHTVNGTACAVPRMMISILEQNQQKYRQLSLPEVLWPYFDEQSQFKLEIQRSSYTYIKTLRHV